jgi:hypothetical protein
MTTPAPALLTPDERIDVRNVLFDGLGLALNDIALDAVVAGGLIEEVRRWGTDTEVTTELCDAVCRTLLGQALPAYGSRPTPEDEDAFFAQLHAAAAGREWLGPVFHVVDDAGHQKASFAHRDDAEQFLVNSRTGGRVTETVGERPAR